MATRANRAALPSKFSGSPYYSGGQFGSSAKGRRMRQKVLMQTREQAPVAENIRTSS